MNKHIDYRLQSFLCFGVILFFLFTASTVSYAQADIVISELNVEQVDDEILVACVVNYDIHDKVEIALDNGIQMTFSLLIELRQDRGYWPDATVATVNKSFNVKYHALSEHYVVMDVDNAVEKSFPRLRDAFVNQGQFENISLASLGLLLDEEEYYVRAKAFLSSENLPLPLRVKSYFSADWRPSSGWTRWPI